MRLIGTQWVGAILLGFVALAGAQALGQESAGTPSLGEVARRLKAEREKEKQAPVPVYTNDNLPGENTVGLGTLQRAEGANKEGLSKEARGTAEGVAEKHGEEYFRAKADKIRARMELHQRQLAVLQQELGLGKMQYYPNPQKTLDQESSPAFQSDVNKLRSKIADKQKQISEDKKAMDDLNEELRREGGDPGWIR